MYDKDLVDINRLHSTTIRITISDRKNDKGIIRTSEIITLFDGRNEDEANEYYMKAINSCSHYCIIKEKIEISSTTRYDDNFVRGN
jgi:hypothetical protein